MTVDMHFKMDHTKYCISNKYKNRTVTIKIVTHLM